MENQEQQVAQQQSTPTPSPFSGGAWSEELPKAPEAAATEPAPTAEQQQPTPPTEQQAAPTVEPPAEEVVDLEVVLEREFGTKDIAALKAEREELKKLKESPQSFQYENDESKLLHEYLKEGKKKELLQFLETQDKLEVYSSAEVTTDNAEDIIKLGMKIKNPNLSQSEIDFLFKEDYVAGKEPVQRSTEDDEDFQERHSEWKERADKVAMKRMVAAKLAQPDLQKAKVNIVLPELQRQIQQPEQPSQESLEQVTKQREAFLNKLESDYAKFDGFATKVKDESVELPVQFKVPDEAKVAIKDRFKAGFDLNGFIDSRWSDASGNTNINQIMSDIFVLENLDKVLSGVANDAANQRLAEYIKTTKNINLSGTPQQTFSPSQSGNNQPSPFSKGAWSEKPPVLTN